MGNRRFWSFVLAAGILLLAGCAAPGTEPKRSDSSWEDEAVREGYAEFCEGRFFADELPEEELPRPKRLIGSLEDFVYALDYMAFYRVDAEVFFDIDPDYARSFFNPYTEFEKAYQQADLADVYACRLEDAYYSDFGVVAVKYSMSRDLAENPTKPDMPNRTVPSFDRRPAEKPIRTLPIEASGRTPISCENGEQLYYLAMNGYRPVPKPGSRAELLYHEARNVLETYVAEGFSDFQKIKAVYDYLTTEIAYDRGTASSGETYLVGEQAYYLEGVLLNHCAVCDGKAKACALMLNMLEVPCFRTTGVREEADHAWNMVRCEGRWYTCCTTYGQSRYLEELDRFVPNYGMMLAGRQTPYPDRWQYEPQKHPEICAQIQDGPYDVYEALGRYAGVSLKISDWTQAEEILACAKKQGLAEYKVEFAYVGGDPEEFKQRLAEYAESENRLFAREINCEGGRAYQIICLKEHGRSDVE
ncbi:MAG: hypothetical protein SOR89_05620 [Ndongobacter sp.]|nr:hypothetical protein [Ndongobacter sp.]